MKLLKFTKVSYSCMPLIAMIIFCSSSMAQVKKQPVDYVDNFIGVRDINSSCVLGPQLPQGSINPSPHTAPGNNRNDMDCYIMGQPIRGFGQLHVSGTGWGKYGQVFISPQIGLTTAEADHDSPKTEETATPYEYSVKLSRYGIKTTVTPAVHAAIYRFTFPTADSASIMLDVSHNVTDIATAMRGPNSRFMDGSVTFTTNDGTELKGYGTYTGGFSDGPYNVYFCIRLSRKPTTFGTWINDQVNAAQSTQKLLQKNDRIGAYAHYATKDKEIIYLKVGVSLKSEKQSTAWLDAEIPGWHYEKVKNAAKNSWAKELGKITVNGGTELAKTIFYTAAYHTSVMPRNRTNDSKHFDNNVPVWDDHLAVWDTWRTLYPLKIFTNPSMVSGTVNSFIARLQKNKKVKDAYVAGNDMNAEQGGNNIDNIIADAFVKNVKGINWKAAYQLMKHQADNERNGIGYGRPDSSKMYKELGWIPAGKMSNSVSLEYAYNDFCTAQMAKQLGTLKEHKNYLERSGKWTALWNPDAESDGYKGFIVPKRLGEGFVPIDLKKNWGSWKDYFYEGSSWTYSYFVPHDFEKLVSISGGKEMFAKKLQHAFEKNLIDYGNEPAFLAVHSFHYADRSDLASRYVRRLMKDRFTMEGCKENDDSGAMSSWYIFSCMGFFPNAGQNIYYLTGAAFPSVTLTMSNGKKLLITAKGASDTNIYIQSCRINGKPWKKFWFTHQDIANGGTMEFTMGSTPTGLLK